VGHKIKGIHYKHKPTGLWQEIIQFGPQSSMPWDINNVNWLDLHLLHQKHYVVMLQISNPQSSDTNARPSSQHCWHQRNCKMMYLQTERQQTQIHFENKPQL
jgi:hypothetical protein